eukprot:1140506-Prorocentrum_minimum.AAC.1
MGWQGSATRRSIDGSKSTTYNTYINPVGEGVDGVEGAGVGKAPKRSSSRWRRALVGGNKYTNPQHLETEKTSAHKSEHISLKERMKALKSSVFSSKSKSKEIPETWHTNSQYSVVDEGRTHSVTTADSKSPTSPGKLVCMPIPGKEYQSHTNRQRIMVDASFPAGCALQDFFSESCFQSPLEPVVVWVSDTTAIILLPLG